MSKEAMKLALEALEWAEFLVESDERSCQDAKHSVDKAITALREALAEQPAQQEPVAWHGYDLDGMVEAFDRVIQAHCYSKHPFHNPVDSDAQMALRILRGFIPLMKRVTSPQPAQQHGWKLAPLEPTQEMIDAVPTKPHPTRPNGWGDRNVAIYKAMAVAAPQPAQRTWVGLTKAEVDTWDLPDHPTVFEFVQFVEAKLKEKNGA